MSHVSRVSYQAFLPPVDDGPASRPATVSWTRRKDAGRSISVALSREQLAWLRAAGAATSPDDVVRALVDVAMDRLGPIAPASRKELRARVTTGLLGGRA